jgi:hypothetical protein
MKLRESMNQAVTKVNDVGPVILLVAKADAPHISGRQYYFSRKWQERDNFVGVLGDGMIQDGLFVNLGDLHCSATRVERQYAETSLEGQGLANDFAEVGLEGSTRSEISTRTWGSVQQVNASFNTRFVNPPRLCK